MTKSNTNPDDLGGLANELTNEFGNLANEAKYAAVTAENHEVNQTNVSNVWSVYTWKVSFPQFSCCHVFVSRLVLILRSRWVSWVLPAQVWWQKLELFSAALMTPLLRKSWLKAHGKSLRRSEHKLTHNLSFEFFFGQFVFIRAVKKIRHFLLLWAFMWFLFLIYLSIYKTYKTYWFSCRSPMY